MYDVMCMNALGRRASYVCVVVLGRMLRRNAYGEALYDTNLGIQMLDVTVFMQCYLVTLMCMRSKNIQLWRHKNDGALHHIA